MKVSIEAVYSPSGSAHLLFESSDPNSYNRIRIEHNGVAYRLHVDAHGNLVLGAHGDGGLVIRGYSYNQIALGKQKEQLK